MAHIQTGRSREEEASPPPVQSSTTRLRGLPYSATEEDLIAFFEDFDIKSTHICKRSGALRPRLPCVACPVLAFAVEIRLTASVAACAELRVFAGRASGEAYVQFASETEAERALKTKNRQHMGQRYIEYALVPCCGA